ncbi:MAG: 50S ribosomal protein L29 [Deltaproteobacteria bacterium]|nr:50S ribosomal protein L29 [Deltaproteobacteria bacterium]
MTPNEVREKSTEELLKMTNELQEEIFRLRFRKNSGQLKQTSNIGKVRHDLARVKTVLVERKSEAGKEKR